MSGSGPGGPDEVTDGTLLGGRVRYRQFARGHRTGFEPVLLAAAVPARAGQRVLEVGTGAGAGLLCLAARIPGVAAVGVELDGATAALGRANLVLNRLPDCHVARADAAALPFTGGTFDHAFANPPWHDARGTASPDPRRRLAHEAAAGTLASWIAAMAAALRPGGSLSLILPTAQAAAADAALHAAGCGAIRHVPLIPRLGRPPGQTILQAAKGAAPGTAVMPGLVLHEGAGLTSAADAILRGGGALPQSTSGEWNTA